MTPQQIAIEQVKAQQIRKLRPFLVDYDRSGTVGQARALHLHLRGAIASYVEEIAKIRTLAIFAQDILPHPDKFDPAVVIDAAIADAIQAAQHELVSKLAADERLELIAKCREAFMNEVAQRTQRFLECPVYSVVDYDPEEEKRIREDWAAVREQRLAEQERLATESSRRPDSTQGLDQPPSVETPVVEVTDPAVPSSQNAHGTSEYGNCWEDIELRFLGEQRLQILVRGTPGAVVNFAELGFEDRRGGGGKPKLAWGFLQVLARNSGIVPQQAISGQQDIQKRAQELRDILCQWFRIAANPIDFVEGVGYNTRFKVTRAPSCES